VHWPWQRERTEDGGEPPRPPAAAPAPMGWAFLPPLQRTLGTIEPVTAPLAFPRQLPAWRDPRHVASGLTHVVSPEAPSGIVDGDGRGGAEPRHVSRAVELTLLPPSPPAVQRATGRRTPATPLTSAATVPGLPAVQRAAVAEAPPRRATAEPEAAAADAAEAGSDGGAEPTHSEEPVVSTTEADVAVAPPTAPPAHAQRSVTPSPPRPELALPSQPAATPVGRTVAAPHTPRPPTVTVSGPAPEPPGEPVVDRGSTVQRSVAAASPRPVAERPATGRPRLSLGPPMTSVPSSAVAERPPEPATQHTPDPPSDDVLEPSPDVALAPPPPPDAGPDLTLPSVQPARDLPPAPPEPPDAPLSAPAAPQLPDDVRATVEVAEPSSPTPTHSATWTTAPSPTSVTSVTIPPPVVSRTLARSPGTAAPPLAAHPDPVTPTATTEMPVVSRATTGDAVTPTPPPRADSPSGVMVTFPADTVQPSPAGAEPSPAVAEAVHEVPVVSRTLEPASGAPGPGPAPVIRAADLSLPSIADRTSDTPTTTTPATSAPATTPSRTTAVGAPTVMRVLDPVGRADTTPAAPGTSRDRPGHHGPAPSPAAVRPVVQTSTGPTYAGPGPQPGTAAPASPVTTLEPPRHQPPAVQLALAPPPVPPPTPAAATAAATTPLDPALYAAGLAAVGPTVQRAEVVGPPPDPPPVTVSPVDGGAAAPGASGGGATGAAASTPEQVEALAGKLWPAVLRRIRHELVVDRERVGLRTDTW